MLPPTPNKPSTLLLLRSAKIGNVLTNYQLPSVALSPTLAHYRHAGSINFPKVSASPTRSTASHVTTWSRHDDEPYTSYRSASTQPPFYGDLRHIPRQQLPNGCKPGETLGQPPPSGGTWSGLQKPRDTIIAVRPSAYGEGSGGRGGYYGSDDEWC